MDNKYLSIKSVNCQKGIFTLWVLWHHLYQYSGLFNIKYVRGVFQAMGYLSVGMFFFYTGYGLMLSNLTKKEYMNTFIRKRLAPVYVYYVVLVFIYALYRLLLGETLSVRLFLKSFVFGETYVIMGWFFQVIFVVYLLFYVVCKLFKPSSNQIIILFLCLVGYSLLCKFIGFPTTWYESVFCVSIGQLWALYKKQIDTILQKKPFLCFNISSIAFVVFFVCSNYFLTNVVLKILSSLSFATSVVIIVWIIQDFPIIINKITSYLGDHSLAIYASQGMLLNLKEKYDVGRYGLYAFVVLTTIGTWILAIPMQKLYLAIKKLVIKGN